jgi:hypothetical protein
MLQKELASMITEDSDVLGDGGDEEEGGGILEGADRGGEEGEGREGYGGHGSGMGSLMDGNVMGSLR